MKQLIKMFLLVASVLMLTACPKLEQNARDTAAALGGAITSAQTQHQAECTANKTLVQCQIINRALAGQNALITATEAYCGWSTQAPPPDPTTTCVPVANAAGALKTAILDANEFITELKGVIK